MRRLLWLGLLLASSACAGTETGNPSVEGTLEYNTYTSQPASVALRVAEPEDAGVTVVNAAWLVLGDVTFVPGTDVSCDPDAETQVHAHGLGVGNHASGEAATTPLTIEAGRYCGVRFPLERTAKATAGAPDALADHSALISGTTADGRPFEIRSRLQTDLFLRASDAKGFALDAERARVLIGFDVAVWLGDLDFSDAVADDDGVIVIDEDTNSALLERFEAVLHEGTALYRDPSGDGDVDPDSAKLAAGIR